MGARGFAFPPRYTAGRIPRDTRHEQELNE
jgi:hypothetical protein